MLFDTHAHYFDEKFGTDEEKEQRIVDVLKDVPHIICCATNSENVKECKKYADKYNGIYFASGLHPEDISDDSATNDTVLKDVFKYLDDEKCVALGEIGLDYHWRDDNKEEQKRIFEMQLEVAREKDVPVIVHDRDAHGDCIETVKKYKGVRGVFHSYSGSLESAKELLKLGWYISFSGVITFKNATRLWEIVRNIPNDRILIETDCPYLSPVPHRGEINDSRFMKFTAMKAAEIRGTDVNDFISLTEANAYNLFGIME